MHQVKLFTGAESRIEDLERDVNEFLAKGDLRVVNMFGNIAPQTPVALPERVSETGRRFGPSDLFLCVVYEK